MLATAPRKMRLQTRITATALMVAVAVVAAQAAVIARQVATISGAAYAIDGDTIRIEGEGKVRLQGVAAPERNERGGTEATDFMKRLVNGKDVHCELDGSRTHDRRVGVCFIEGKDIGEAIIEAGLARDCPRFSGGRYRGAEKPAAAELSFPGYCKAR